MIREIGSSFSDIELLPEKSGVFSDLAGSFFSGRSAIYSILDDILQTGKGRKALLPSFCCDSMIEPFLAHGMTVSFYDIILEDELIYSMPQDDADIILFLNYFGVDTRKTKEFGSEIRKSYPSAILIEDRTHSLFAESGSGYADYEFASIRKWTGFSDGGIVIKAPKKIRDCSKENRKYAEIFAQASRLKKQYLEAGEGEKSDFLKLYNEAEEMLDADYKGYSASRETLEGMMYLDVDLIKKKRIENFNILCENADTIRKSGAEPLFSKLDRADVPLFFPVIFKNSEERSIVRKRLIENEIYCPVHWPVSELHSLNPKTSSIYERELSIICDQRYGPEDMMRIADVLAEF